MRTGAGPVKVHDCGTCGQRVIRARTEGLKWQLLDPLPDANGNVHARKDHTGTWFARTVPPGTPAAAPEVLLMPHFASSPACGQAAKRKGQRDQVKAAQSAHAREKRNQRGRRPGAVARAIETPGMFRVNPDERKP